MSFCVVPECTNQLRTLTTTLPRNKDLLRRWKDAVQVGTGQCLPDEIFCRGAPICQMHFQFQPSENGGRDECPEPALFLKGNIQFHVASCRLCLRYDFADKMFGIEDSLVHRQSLQWMINKYFKWLQPKHKDTIENGYLCEQCTVRIDMTHTFWLEINESAKEQQDLIRKYAIEKVTFKDTVAVSLAQEDRTDSNQEEINQLDDLAVEPKEDIVIKQEDIVIKQESALVDLELSQEEFSDDSGGDELSEDSEEKIELWYTKSPGHEDIVENQINDIIVKEEPQFAEALTQQQTDLDEPEAVEIEPIRPSRYKCFICNTVQDSKRGLIIHLTVEHKDLQSFNCEPCNLSFARLSALNIHLRFHATVRRYKCDLCPQSFDRQFGKMRHETTMHGIDHDLTIKRKTPKKMKCSICDKVFDGKLELIRHQQVEHKGPFFCEICNKTYKTATILGTHMMIHRNERPYKCKTCGSCFRNKRYLVIHNELVHPLVTRTGGDSLNAATCNVCQAKYDHPDDMVNHFRELHPERDLRAYPCRQCAEVFFQFRSLDFHRNIHKEKFSCEQCGLRHYTNRELDRHRHTVHGVALHNLPTEAKPFSCSLCGKSFRSHRHLNIHTKTHSGEKPYTCTDCGTKFTQSYNVNRHKKICSKKKDTDT